jgi:hypothetical protein
MGNDVPVFAAHRGARRRCRVWSAAHRHRGSRARRPHHDRGAAALAHRTVKSAAAAQSLYYGASHLCRIWQRVLILASHGWLQQCKVSDVGRRTFPGIWWLVDTCIFVGSWAVFRDTIRGLSTFRLCSVPPCKIPAAEPSERQLGTRHPAVIAPQRNLARRPGVATVHTRCECVRPSTVLQIARPSSRCHLQPPSFARQPLSDDRRLLKGV